MTTPLSTILKNYTNTATDSNWIRFIQDHKEYIKNRSNRRQLNINEISIYKNKLREFITVQQLCPYDLVWILFLINDMTDRMSLENKNALYVPDTTTINDLKKKYNTFTSKQTL